MSETDRVNDQIAAMSEAAAAIAGVIDDTSDMTIDALRALAKLLVLIAPLVAQNVRDIAELRGKLINP